MAELNQKIELDGYVEEEDEDFEFSVYELESDSSDDDDEEVLDKNGKRGEFGATYDEEKVDKIVQR